MYELICDVISCCVWSCDMDKINVLTLRRNLMSLAIFNTIFWKIVGGLLFLGHPVCVVWSVDVNLNNEAAVLYTLTQKMAVLNSSIRCVLKRLLANTLVYGKYWSGTYTANSNGAMDVSISQLATYSASEKGRISRQSANMDILFGKCRRRCRTFCSGSMWRMSV